MSCLSTFKTKIKYTKNSGPVLRFLCLQYVKKLIRSLNHRLVDIDSYISLQTSNPNSKALHAIFLLKFHNQFI